MQSNNPVFNRSEGFDGQAVSFDKAPGSGSTTFGERRMTIDSVVQSSAMTIGVVFIAAIAIWVTTPSFDDPTADFGTLYTAAMVGSLGAFALSMVNSFKRIVSPALVIAFAVLEGVALGAISKVFDAQFGGGIVTTAVFGTFAAFAATLAVYKFFNIRVSAKFQRGVMIAVFAMLGLSLMELVMGMFGNSFGLFGLGGLGLITAIAGIVLATFMLIMDFDMIEQGIASGLPERESWRAAFALTVSLVWLYTNLLRLLAILQND